MNRQLRAIMQRTPGIERIQRWRALPGDSASQGVDDGQHDAAWRPWQPPARRSRRGRAARSARRLRRVPSAIGIMPAIIAAAVIRMARRRPRAATQAPRRRRRPPRCRRSSAKVTSRIELATAMPIAMMAPMNDCTFSVVPVERQQQHHAAQHGRHRDRARRAPAGTTGSSPASSRKIAATATQQPDAQAASRSPRAAAIWPRSVTVTPRGGSPARAMRRADRTWRPRPSAMPCMLAVRLTTRCML